MSSPSNRVKKLKSVIRVCRDAGGQPAFFKTGGAHVDGTDTAATGAVQIELDTVTAQRNPAFRALNTGSLFLTQLAKHPITLLEPLFINFNIKLSTTQLAPKSDTGRIWGLLSLPFSPPTAVKVPLSICTFIPFIPLCDSRDPFRLAYLRLIHKIRIQKRRPRLNLYLALGVLYFN